MISSICYADRIFGTNACLSYGHLLNTHADNYQTDFIFIFSIHVRAARFVGEYMYLILSSNLVGLADLAGPHCRAVPDFGGLIFSLMWSSG